MLLKESSYRIAVRGYSAVGWGRGAISEEMLMKTGPGKAAAHLRYVRNDMASIRRQLWGKGLSYIVPIADRLESAPKSGSDEATLCERIERLVIPLVLFGACLPALRWRSPSVGRSQTAADLQLCKLSAQGRRCGCAATR